MAFQLRQGSYKYLIEAVKNRELNLALLGPIPPKDESLNVNVLFSENMYALLPLSHPLTKNETINLIDLRNDDFVMFPEGYILHKVVMDACRSLGFAPNITSEGEDMDALKGLVAAGIGVTLLPESSLYDSTPRLTVKIPIAMPVIRRTVGIIYPTTRDLAPSEQIFLSFVSDFFSRLTQFQ